MWIHRYLGALTSVSGARTTDKSDRTTGSKKRWCEGKVGREHDYRMGLPKWARDWDKRDIICKPWDVAYGKKPWYCRHVLICTKCERNTDLPSAQCPDRPEDDGTIEFYER